MEAVSAQGSRVRIFEALRHRDFRLLWGGQAVSLLGDMAFLTALGWKYGLLTTSLGVGTVLGTLAFGQLQPRRKRGVIAYALWLVNSFAIAGVALSPWFPLASAFAVVRGACLAFGIAIWETMLQELVPEHLLARVISLDFFGSFALMPIGLAIWAAIANLAAAGTMIATGAFVSCVLVSIALTRRWLWEVD